MSPIRPPILEFDPAEAAIINAADWHAAVPGVPQAAVITWMKNAHDAIVDEHGRGAIYEVTLESNTFVIHEIDWHGRAVALALSTIGAPAAAALLETMIAIGSEHFITVGSAGGLVPELAPGTVVVPDHLIRDEGTSYHYASEAEPVLGDPELADNLLRALADRDLNAERGTVWTTDAFYRETAERVERRVAAGAVAVDMEASAMAAIAAFRDVRLASAVYLADTLHGDRWDPTELVERDLSYRTRLLSAALDAATLPASGAAASVPSA